MLNLALHEIEKEPADNRQRDDEAESAPNARSPEFDWIILWCVAGGEMIGGARKPTPHNALGTNLFTLQPIKNTLRLVLTLASRTAALAYTRLLAFTHDLPALKKRLASQRRTTASRPKRRSASRMFDQT
jgi:hypothetical protein